MKHELEKISPYLFPNPALLISCKSSNKESIITLSWVGTSCSEPPMVSVGIRPTRYSYNIIKESGEFVINVPTSEMIEKVKFCGTKSGKDVDKWMECNFTREKPSKVNTPLIKECPVNIECTVKKIIELGSHHLFIAEIVAVHMDENWRKSKYEGMLTYSLGQYGKTVPL
ncbi:MAG: flavin reductase family protein [Candidatus Heimdallarchaeaceae archaeon]